MIEKAGNGRKDYRGTQVELVKRTVRTVHKQGLLELVRHTRGECDTTPPKSTISAAPDVDTPLHVNFALVQGPGPPRLAEEPPPWQTHDRDHTAARREHGGLSCVKHQLCTTNTSRAYNRFWDSNILRVSRRIVACRINRFTASPGGGCVAAMFTRTGSGCRSECCVWAAACRKLRCPPAGGAGWRTAEPGSLPEDRRTLGEFSNDSLMDGDGMALNDVGALRL